MNTLKNFCLLFPLVFLFTHCKKEPGLDPLAYVVFPKHGIIRIECADCTINYSILKANYVVQVKESEDITFDYISDFELKTIVHSRKKQLIRLVIFDAYGRIISNALTGIDPNNGQTGSFKIKID